MKSNRISTTFRNVVISLSKNGTKHMIRSEPCEQNGYLVLKVIRYEMNPVSCEQGLEQRLKNKIQFICLQFDIPAIYRTDFVPELEECNSGDHLGSSHQRHIFTSIPLRFLSESMSITSIIQRIHTSIRFGGPILIHLQFITLIFLS